MTTFLLPRPRIHQPRMSSGMPMKAVRIITVMSAPSARIKLGRSLLRQTKYADAAAESLGGSEILRKQAEPSVSFLKAARTDLVAAYEALGQTTEAARFRAETAAAGGR